MTACTFKLFKSNGDCRRVRFNDTPKLDEINRLIDGIVCASSEQRSLTYIDSEGDRVIIKSPRDLCEALRDANESSAETIKLYISNHHYKRYASQRPCNGDRDPPPQQQNQRQREGCGDGQRRPAGRCGRGRGSLFFHPFWGPVWGEGRGRSDWDLIAEDMTEVMSQLFPGFAHCRAANEKKGEADEASKKPSEAPAAQEGDGDNGALFEKPDRDVQEGQRNPASVDVPAAEPQDEQAMDVPSDGENQDQDRPNGTVDKQNVDNHNPNSNPNPQHASPTIPSSTSGNDVDVKANLLREMGFDIPLEVARNMIVELGGRTDLVVRALVANQK